MATKSNQERILAIEISRERFEWALEYSCLSSYHADIHSSNDAWRAELAATPVRIQWDPERDIHTEPRPERTIQIGLDPEASKRYVNDWINNITDVTTLASEIRASLRAGNLKQAQAKRPRETPYPLTPELARHIGAESN